MKFSICIFSPHFANKRVDNVLAALAPDDDWRASTAEWLRTHVREHSAADVECMLAERSFLTHSWPFNNRLPRPKPAREPRAYNFKEIAQRIFSVFAAAGVPQCAVISPMILEHFVDRYPTMYDKRDFNERRSVLLYNASYSVYGKELDIVVDRIAEIQHVIGVQRRPRPGHQDRLRAALSRKRLILQAIHGEWLERLSADARLSRSADVRARGALREWAANRIRRTVRDWLYAPPTGPLFLSTMRALADFSAEMGW